MLFHPFLAILANYLIFITDSEVDYITEFLGSQKIVLRDSLVSHHSELLYW